MLDGCELKSCDEKVQEHHNLLSQVEKTIDETQIIQEQEVSLAEMITDDF